MKQHWQPETELPVKQSELALRRQLAQMEEVNQYLEQNLFRQREIESQLTQAIRELEIRNFEISAGRDQALVELHERERGELALRRKTEELSRSNRDLEQFASLAAHDLQEPLHSIQVFLDLLRVKHGSSLNEQGQSYLNRVTKAAGRMQQLIEGLLVYSRIDAPDSTVMSLSLGDIVEEILTDLAAYIEELQAEIHVGDLPMIHGDPLQIRQLLQNLISNALKFHKRGVAPIIHISGMMIKNRRHSRSGNPGSLCQIEIQDQGIGISAEHLDKIFGMFKRLHRKEEYEGAGIGLAVCERIADQCGGAISVRSVLGEGSTFTVTLPAWLEK
jgi:light-regulated signal transduction histidine kinase (bacteriophytochrome)